MVTGRFSGRFLGAAAWADLSPDVQAAIGAIALELVVAAVGEDVAICEEDEVRAHLFSLASAAAASKLDEVAVGALVAIEVKLAEGQVPIPSIVGPVCRSCGGLRGAEPVWADTDLCIACSPLAHGEIVNASGSGPEPIALRAPSS